MRNRSSTADSCFGKFEQVHLHLTGLPSDYKCLNCKRDFHFLPTVFFLMKATVFPSKDNQFQLSSSQYKLPNFVCHIIVAPQINANWPRDLMLIKKLQMDICKEVSGCQSCILAKLAFTPFKNTVVAGKSTNRLVKNTLKIN